MSSCPPTTCVTTGIFTARSTPNPPPIAVIGVHHAAPRLGGLALHLDATAHAPFPADPERAPQRHATRVPIARLISLSVRVQHLLREQETAEPPSAPALADIGRE